MPYKVGDILMEDKSVLFLLKDLEKKILRFFLANQDVNMPKPTPTQLQIIWYLIKKGEAGVYQKELESLFSLKRATVSGVLQTMEKNGLIYRVIDENDTRTKKIYLQAKTKKLFLEGQEKLKQIEQQLIQNISKEEMESFKKTLEKMIHNV